MKPRRNLSQKSNGTDPEATMVGTPFISFLKSSRDQVRAQRADPWHLRLERVRGKMGDDGVERISTQAIFDILELPQARRNAGACRRLASLMRQFGWSAIKARGLTPGGFK